MTTAAITLLCAVGGCGGDGESAAKPGGRASTSSVADEFGRSPGLDVAYWIVSDSPARLGAAFGAYEGASAPPSGILCGEAWRRNGLRIIKVPLAAANELLPRLTVAGPLRQEALGVIPQWTPLASGPEWRRIVLLQADARSGRREFPTGRFRLLARCWSMPLLTLAQGHAQGSGPPLDAAAPGVGASLVLELVPQHVASAESPFERISLGAPTARPGAELDGEVLADLALSLRCDEPTVLVIVPASSEEKWEAPPEEDAGATDSVGVGEAPADRPIDKTDVRAANNAAEGPSTPPLISVGEAMLTDAGAGNTARTRVIVVIRATPLRQYGM